MDRERLRRWPRPSVPWVIAQQVMPAGPARGAFAVTARLTRRWYLLIAPVGAIVIAALAGVPGGPRPALAGTPAPTAAATQVPSDTDQATLIARSEGLSQITTDIRTLVSNNSGDAAAIVRAGVTAAANNPNAQVAVVQGALSGSPTGAAQIVTSALSYLGASVGSSQYCSFMASLAQQAPGLGTSLASSGDQIDAGGLAACGVPPGGPAIGLIVSPGTAATYSTGGSYCTAGAGQIWVPTGASPASYGC